MCKSISDHKLVNAWVYATIMTDEWSWVELTKKWEMNFMAPVIFIVPMFGIKEIVVSWNDPSKSMHSCKYSNTWRSNILFTVLIEILGIISLWALLYQCLHKENCCVMEWPSRSMHNYKFKYLKKQHLIFSFDWDAWKQGLDKAHIMANNE